MDIDASQRFIFGLEGAPEPLGSFKLDNIYVPALGSPSLTNFEMRNNALSGYRWIHETASTDTYGSFKLQKFLMGSTSGIDLMTFNDDGSFTIPGLTLGSKYIIQQPDDNLPNAQALGSLATGLLKSTTTTGVLSIATAGTDYYAPDVDNNLNLNSHKVTNLLDPDDPQDAATKSWVLSQIDGTFGPDVALPFGQLNYNWNNDSGGSPYIFNQAINDSAPFFKQHIYQVTSVSPDIQRKWQVLYNLGDPNAWSPGYSLTFTHPIFSRQTTPFQLSYDGSATAWLLYIRATMDMGGFEITNALNPTTAQSLATKNYVDSQVAGSLNLPRLGIGITPTVDGRIQFASTVMDNKISMRNVSGNDYDQTGFGVNSIGGTMYHAALNTTHTFYLGNSTTIPLTIDVLGINIAQLRPINADYRRIMLYDEGENLHQIYNIGIKTLDGTNHAIHSQISNFQAAFTWAYGLTSVSSYELMRLGNDKLIINNGKLTILESANLTSWDLTPISDGTFSLGKSDVTANKFTFTSTPTSSIFSILNPNSAATSYFQSGTSNDSVQLGYEGANDYSFINIQGASNDRLAFRVNGTGIAAFLASGLFGFGTISPTAAKVQINGGVQNVSGEESVIRAISSSSSCKLELQNTTPATGKLWEVRSNSNGSFSVVERPSGNLNMLIDVANVALGERCLQNTTGLYNTAVGDLALSSNTTGTGNSCFGAGTGECITQGDSNVAMGSGALNAGILSSNNCAIGKNAFSQLEGNENTALGYLAGNNHTQYTNCTFLGSRTDASVNNLTNAAAIGYNASVSSSNSMVLGNGVNVGIGTPSPTLAKLQINGGVQNIANEETAIHVRSALNNVKIELQCTNGTGRIYEIRSVNNGSYDITDRTGSRTLYTLDSSGNHIFNTVGTVFAKRPRGYLSMSGNVTATVTVAATWVKIAGTTILSGTSNLFDMPVNNRLRYTGTPTLLNGTINVSLTFTYSSSVATRIGFSIFKNGVLLADTPKYITNNNTNFSMNIGVNAATSFATNDYIEIYLNSPNGGVNLTTTDLSITVE